VARGVSVDFGLYAEQMGFGWSVVFLLRCLWTTSY